MGRACAGFAPPAPPPTDHPAPTPTAAAPTAAAPPLLVLFSHSPAALYPSQPALNAAPSARHFAAIPFCCHNAPAPTPAQHCQSPCASAVLLSPTFSALRSTPPPHISHTHKNTVLPFHAARARRQQPAASARFPLEFASACLLSQTCSPHRLYDTEPRPAVACNARTCRAVRLSRLFARMGSVGGSAAEESGGAAVSLLSPLCLPGRSTALSNYRRAGAWPPSLPAATKQLSSNSLQPHQLSLSGQRPSHDVRTPHSQGRPGGAAPPEQILPFSAAGGRRR